MTVINTFTSWSIEEKKKKKDQLIVINEQPLKPDLIGW